MEIDRKFIKNVYEFSESLDDKYDGNKHSKTLLRKTRDVSDKCTQIERHDEHKRQADPHSDPKSKTQVVQLLISVTQEMHLNTT